MEAPFRNGDRETQFNTVSRRLLGRLATNYTARSGCDNAVSYQHPIRVTGSTLMEPDREFLHYVDGRTYRNSLPIASGCVRSVFDCGQDSRSSIGRRTSQIHTGSDVSPPDHRNDSDTFEQCQISWRYAKTSAPLTLSRHFNPSELPLFGKESPDCVIGQWIALSRYEDRRSNV
jgi:hypothetical protein